MSYSSSHRPLFVKEPGSPPPSPSPGVMGGKLLPEGLMLSTEPARSCWLGIYMIMSMAGVKYGFFILLSSFGYLTMNLRPLAM